MILTIKLTGTVIFNTFFFQRIVTVVIYFLFYKVDYSKLSVLFLSCGNLLAFIYIPMCDPERNDHIQRDSMEFTQSETSKRCPDA